MFKFIKELKEIKNSPKLSKQECADKMAQIKLPPLLSLLSKHITTLEVILMWAIPAITCFKIFAISTTMSEFNQYLAWGLIPLIYSITFILIGGFFATFSKFGILEGKFPRSHTHPIYALRRIYGTAWTQLYYFKPIYSLCLAIPPLKKMLFRIYGFKGDLSFVTYPDSWIRDLPLLDIGKNVYLANRCVVGTNLCLSDNSILVGKCKFGDNAILGHLAIFGLGCIIGKQSEIGVNAGLGIRVTIKTDVAIGPMSLVYHACELGHNVRIGAAAVIGMKSKIADNVEIKPGAIIPLGSIIINQSEADKHFAGETQMLSNEKDNLFKVLSEQLRHDPAFKTS